MCSYTKAETPEQKMQREWLSKNQIKKCPTIDAKQNSEFDDGFRLLGYEENTTNKISMSHTPKVKNVEPGHKDALVCTICGNHYIVLIEKSADSKLGQCAKCLVLTPKIKKLVKFHGSYENYQAASNRINFLEIESKKITSSKHSINLFNLYTKYKYKQELIQLGCCVVLNTKSLPNLEKRINEIKEQMKLSKKDMDFLEILYQKVHLKNEDNGYTPNDVLKLFKKTTFEKILGLNKYFTSLICSIKK